MTKTMDIDELISKLKEYDGELTVKVWSGGAEKPYPISNVAAGTMCAYIGIDDRNLVDLSKIWHDASEEPKHDEYLLGEDTDGFSIYWWCGQAENWEAFLNETGLSRWAYISDLLPKGGEK